MMRVTVRKKMKKQKPQRGNRTTSVTNKEVTALGRAIRTLGSTMGAGAGAFIGQPGAGGVVGNSLAGALSRWLGAGDYVVGTNSVVTKSLKAASSIPSMHTDAQSIVVRHREYIGEVRSSQAFTVQQSFPLNPGIAATFPWLSDIASRFQEYKIKGMVFHYIPSSGSAVSSTNAALGTVMLQTSYRSTDAAPASKLELLNEYCSNEVVPSDGMAHPIECDPKENPFNVQYVRSGPVPAADTQLMYDLGVTHLAVSGCQTTGNVLGDLWVTYDVELKKPLVASNATFGVHSGLLTVQTVTSTSALLGNAVVTFTGALNATAVNNTITFPKGVTGSFAIYLYFTGSGLALTAAAPTYTGSTSALLTAGGLSDLTVLSNTTIVTRIIGISITDPAVSATVNLNMGGSASTLTGAYAIISQLS